MYHEAAFRARRQSEREQAACDAGVYEASDKRNEKEEEDHARKGEKIDSRPLLKNGENKQKGEKEKGKHTEGGSDYLQKAENMHLQQAESDAARDAPQVSVFVFLY